MTVGCMKITAGLIQQLLIRRGNNRSRRNIDIAYDFVHICDDDRVWKRIENIAVFIQTLPELILIRHGRRLLSQLL